MKMLLFDIFSPSMRRMLKFEVSLESCEELQTGLFWKGIIRTNGVH